MTRKRWDRDSIQNLLRRSPNAAVKALMLVFSYQLEIEKASQDSIEQNSVGFSLYDVKELTILAQYFIRNRELKPHQIDKCKRIMPKYWRQVLNEIKRQHKNQITKQTKTYVILETGKKL